MKKKSKLQSLNDARHKRNVLITVVSNNKSWKDPWFFFCRDGTHKQAYVRKKKDLKFLSWKIWTVCNAECVVVQ